MNSDKQRDSPRRHHHNHHHHHHSRKSRSRDREAPRKERSPKREEKQKEEEKKPVLPVRAGGVYMPPFKMRQMMEAMKNKEKSTLEH